MAKLSILAGATSQTVNVFIQNSSSAVGAGLTGLVFNTSGLTAYYVLPRTSSAAITLATLAAVTSAYSSGGFKEIDSTNAPGLYRLDIPNAALSAASGRFVTLYLQGATNMAPLLLEIELTGWDNQDAVHGGLSALPNTACTTNASLLTSGTGTDQLSVASGRTDLGKILGTAVSTPATAGVLDCNVKNMNNVAATAITTINANQGTTQVVSFTNGGLFQLVRSDMLYLNQAALSTTTAQLGVNVVNLGGTAQTGRDIGASVLVGDKTGFSLSVAGVQAIWDALTSALTTVGSVGKRIADFVDATISTRSTYAGGDTSGTTTLLARIPGTVQPQTGDSYARLGAPAGASVSADIAAVKTDTAAIKAKTDNLPASPAAVSDVRTQVDAALDAAGAELSAIPGATGTLRQKIGALYQYLLFKRATTSTTETMYKADGATSLGTATVSDDGTTATHGKVA